MKKNIKKYLIQSVVVSVFPCASWAGGLYLYEVGTEDLGLAAAGAAARAQDASVMAYNPAGITLLEGDVITTGIQALYGDAQYKLNNESGKNPGNVIGWFPGISLFTSHSVSDDLKIGLGIYGNFGLSMDFGNWAGDRAIKKSSLLGMTIQPTVAYKLDENWSVGGSVMANYGVFDLTRQVGTNEAKLNDADWSSSYKLGVLYQLDTANRFGLSYTSQTRYEFSSQSNGAIGTNFPVRGSINAPQQIMLSSFHKLNCKWALMSNVGWQDWSSYNDNQLILGDIEAPLTNKLKDTWHAAVGVQYQVKPGLRLNTGLAYDSSMYLDQNNASLSMPSGKTIRLGLGAQYDLEKTSSLGVAFEYARVQGSDVSASSLSGSYHPTNLYFLGLNYSRFF